MSTDYFNLGKKEEDKTSKKDTFAQTVENAAEIVNNVFKTSNAKSSSKHEYENIDKIELKNITQVYDDGKGKKNVVFDNFNMKIRDVKGQGQFVCLVGSSGCGKSTLLRYIAGLQQQTSGEVFINGKLKTDQDRVGMVFQQYSSFPWRTVLENVAFPLELKGIEKKERLDKAMEMIKLVGLEGHENKYAQYPTLSGGQLQRVAIARSLASNNEILLMDEAFSAVDVRTRLSLQNLLCDIWTKMPGDPTVIFVGHDLSEAVYLADEIHVMKSNPGEVIEIINVDLPLERNFKLKRDKRFLDHVHYLEDLMMKIENK